MLPVCCSFSNNNPTLRFPEFIAVEGLKEVVGASGVYIGKVDEIPPDAEVWAGVKVFFLRTFFVFVCPPSVSCPSLLFLSAAHLLLCFCRSEVCLLVLLDLFAHPVLLTSSAACRVSSPL